ATGGFSQNAHARRRLTEDARVVKRRALWIWSGEVQACVARLSGGLAEEGRVADNAVAAGARALDSSARAAIRARQTWRRTIAGLCLLEGAPKNGFSCEGGADGDRARKGDHATAGTEGPKAQKTG